MTRRALVLLGLGVTVVAVAVVIATCVQTPRQGGFTMQRMEPVDEQLAAKAQDSCWFKVKNKSGRTEEVRQWSSVTSTGAQTERLGELLIVAGAMTPAVHDHHFYGCSLFEYTHGSPVVMTATTSATPVGVDNVIPYGFSRDEKKQQ